MSFRHTLVFPSASSRSSTPSVPPNSIAEPSAAILFRIEPTHKRPAWIAPRIIQPHRRPRIVLEQRIVPLIRRRLPQNHARAQHHQQHVVTIGQRKRRDRHIENPTAHRSIRHLKPVNQKPVDVHPIHRVFGRVPHRAFAAHISHRCDAHHFAGHGAAHRPAHCTPIPASNPPSTK